MNRDNNKLIAEFLNWSFDGLNFYNEKEASEWGYSTYSLKFHCLWDWLIPVVEKIESIHSNHHGYFGVHISSNSCSIQGTNLHLAIQDLEGYGHVYCDEVVLDTKLESTYQACLRFILWLNKQNKDEFTFNGISS